jgi:hypothetical protein
MEPRDAPPVRGLAERWAIALLIAFVLVPLAVAIFVPLIWATVELWVVTVPAALVIAFFFYARWRRGRAASR